MPAKYFFVLLLLHLQYFTSYASCPDSDDTLKEWSDPNTWDSGEVPSEGDKVKISKHILLNTSPPELASITIKAGGKLVWSSNGNYNVRARYILIETNGEMHIGSEECPFEKKARITLLGDPDEFDIPSFGEKFIGVQSGGTLELHGKDKLSWTKLAQTANKIDKLSGLIYRHKNQIQKYQYSGYPGDKYTNLVNIGQTRASGNIEEDADKNNVTGLVWYHFEPNGRVVDSHTLPIINRQKQFDRKVQELKTYLDNIPDGDVIALATQKNSVRKVDMSGLAAVIKDLTGTDTFSKIGAHDAYTMITKKGSTGTTRESLDQFYIDEQRQFTEASVDYINAAENVRFFVLSKNEKLSEKGSFADFLVIDADATQPIIDVVDDVSSWNVGDEIFITSTDYDWQQVEEVSKIECDSCSANQIKLNVPLFYTHYGQIYKNVDMRAEVGLMTRNILIEGEISRGNTNGGHVKFLHGFKSVRVEGVELTRMGQPLVIGRYPLHYHMCEDLDDPSIYPIRSYIRKNSIHHTTFRCVTIHGTHGAQLTDNVCYDTFGHGFFLEDGGEKRTYFNGNLGLGQRQWKGTMKVPVTGAIPTDTERGPVTFWLTNPQTTLTNNVAAGGEGVGYWFVYPDLPTGPSSTKGYMAYKEARHTKITEFDNNVAHSYFKAGLFVDNIEQEDKTVKGYNKYNPRKNATDPSSPLVAAIFNRLTAYKNIKQNVWIRGATMVLSQASLSDSAEQVTMLNEGGSLRVIYKSVIIGESNNMGEPQKVTLPNKEEVLWPRSLPNGMTVVEGVALVKGPALIENVWFDGFKSSSLYGAGAFAFKCLSTIQQGVSKVLNAKFGFADSSETGNRVYNKKCTEDFIHHFMDLDSSLTDSSGTEKLIVQNDPFYFTSACSYRENWHMLHCPNHFGTVAFKVQNDRTITIMRTDSPYATEDTNDGRKMRFHAILGGSHKYLAYIDDDTVPDSLEVSLKDDMNIDYVVMGLCVPRDAEFEVLYKSQKTVIMSEEVDSLDDVEGDNTGGKYYFDSKVGVIFFKLLSDAERDECFIGKCSTYIFTFTGGDMSDSDCSKRFRNVEEYVSASTGETARDDSVLAADETDPPAEWGAGSTYPVLTLE